MTTHPVVIVGAGVGGLACALRLLSRGVPVEVVDRAAQVGGKLRTVEIDGVALDAGPTVLTMRWVFEELFMDAGARLADVLALTPAETLARHAWKSGSRFDLFADVRRNADAIGTFSGAAEAKRYLAFCDRARAIYRTLEQPFLRASQPNPVSLAKRVGLRGLGGLMRISPFATMWSELSTYFHDPRLKQLFGRYATYCGSSPFLAPATLMLVAHVEQEGVWLVDGGMQRIALAMRALIEARGGRVRCAATVTRIDVASGRAAGVTLESGERVEASAVVFNGDASALSAGLLGDAVVPATTAIRRDQRSLSALTWHVVARTRGFPLVRHNVFFSDDSEREFDALFVDRRLPDDATVYVCAQDRQSGNGASVPAGDAPERLMCLVNAPADADFDPLNPEEIARCEASMFDKLRTCGLQVEWSSAMPRVTTPTAFAQLFPATGGALYGRATHGWAASFDRPSARSKVPGLYLAGGSVHPGPGLPMAALSGRLAADAWLEDRTSRT